MEYLAKLKEPWGLMRSLRLALGIVIAYDAYKSETWWLLLFAGFLLYQAVVNMRCLPCEQTGECTVDTPETLEKMDGDTSFEELKVEK